jgi:uncharacterized repeat protein (TIGR01451 family)
MKKIFSFLIIILLTSNIALAQVTRGVATSWTGGDPGLRTVGAAPNTAASNSGGIIFKAFYNSLDANYSYTDAPILYVEYGTTGSLGTATEGRYQQIGNRVEEFTVPGLDNKKLHYYRAVLLYNNKTAYGEVLEYNPSSATTVTKSDVTTTQTDQASTLVHENEIVSSPQAPDQGNTWPWSLFGGLFSKRSKNIADNKPSSKKENGVSLSITDKVTDTGIGQNVTYTVSYANVSGKNFNDVDIEILLPLEYAFVSSDKGDYYQDAHSVLVKLYEFEIREKGTINVVAEAVGKKSQKSAEASAHLYTETTETVVYDIDNYNPKVKSTSRSARGMGEDSHVAKKSFQTNNSGSANPLAGSSMIGWLIIALIIGGVVFVSYKYFKKDKY